MAGCVVPLAFTRTWYGPHLWYPRNAISELSESRGESLEERGEVCLAEEVERLRQVGLSDAQIASKLGVEASWVETVVSSGEDEQEAR
jgi:predicted transposase YdaD